MDLDPHLSNCGMGSSKHEVSMRERLQKILSSAGIASRRKAETLLEEGRVRVNGTPANLGDTADPEKDRITVDGMIVEVIQKPVYLALYKPRGYLCAVSDERGRKTVTELVAGCGARVYPVGRLDLLSEGLLLMTNDGEFANLVSHPRYENAKTYFVSVRGDAAAALPVLRSPIDIDGRQTQPAEVEILSADGEKAKLRFLLREGRNRQVRRLCEAAGLEVTRLVRYSEGCVTVDGLRPGQWRILTREEVQTFIRP